MKYYIFKVPALIFGLIVILQFSCKNDPQPIVNPNATEGERKYYEDYSSPKDKWGFTDISGKMVIPNQYDDLRDFKNGLACANFNGKWGIIDSMGHIVIPHKYLNISNFSEGKCLVEDFDQNVFYINQKGEKLFNCPTSDCYKFKNGLARYIEDGVTYFMDEKGKKNENFRFSSATDFVDGFARVQMVDQYGVINKEGKNILDPIYKRIKISDGIAMTQTNEKTQYFDLNKNSWIKGEFDSGSTFEDGHATVSLGEQFGLLNPVGEFTPISDTPLRYIKHGRWAKQINGNYQIVDDKGQLILIDTFSNVLTYKCGVLGIEKDQRWGYIDLEGNTLVPPSLSLIFECNEGYIRYITNSGFGYMDAKTNLTIAPKYLDIKDFKEGKARAIPLH